MENPPDPQAARATSLPDQIGERTPSLTSELPAANDRAHRTSLQGIRVTQSGFASFLTSPQIETSRSWAASTQLGSSLVVTAPSRGPRTSASRELGIAPTIVKPG